MIKKATLPLLAFVVAVGTGFTQENRNRSAALNNPVPAVPASLSAGKSAYDTNCASCHGNMAQGAEKAGVVISIIQEQGGKQPPDLTDDKWDHGSSDGEIYSVIKKGVPPTMMAGWDGRLPDTEIWNIVNYLRAVAAKKTVDAAPVAAPEGGPRQTLQLADYVQMPITADPNGENTRAELARVNFMRDEPGSRRFFITDLNGPCTFSTSKAGSSRRISISTVSPGGPGCFSGSRSSATLPPD